MMQAINFWKNVAIAGGLLFVAAHGPGPYAVDRAAR
jgi:putative oxidoreductase